MSFYLLGQAQRGFLLAGLTVQMCGNATDANDNAVAHWTGSTVPVNRYFILITDRLISKAPNQ